MHVLFQETRDKKVVRFCKRLGFGRISELPPATWVHLDEDVDILNCTLGTQWEADSWLCIRTPQGTLLNLNDCGVGEAEALAIKDKVGVVDVLATQFSYAAWQRNVEAVDFRRAEAQKILLGVQEQIAVLKPRYVIPFASFVWFCAEDNFYLNADMNQIRDVSQFISHRTDAEPVIMYPGDRWTVGEPHDSAAAVAKFERDVERITDRKLRPRIRREVVDAAVLVEQGQEFRRRLGSIAHPLLVRGYLAYRCYQNRVRFRIGPLRNLLLLFRAHVEPAHMYLTDLDRAFTFDLRRGLQPTSMPSADCDIMLSSASLSYCFRFDWGGETLQVNGCFRENDGWRSVADWGYPDRFLKYCRLLRRVNLGYELSWRSTVRSVLQRLRLSSQGEPLH